MSWGWLAWSADVLVVLGVVVMTIGVYGLFRMPDVYTQLHATSKAVVLGVIAILVAATATRDAAVILRVILIGVALLVTTPVAAHVIARAAYVVREPLRAPGAIDESGRLEGVEDSGDSGDDEQPVSEEPAGLARVVLAYDGSEAARRALERVLEFANERTVVSVVTAVTVLPTSAGALDEQASVEQQLLLAEAGGRLEERGIPVHRVESLMLGDPAEAIVQAAIDTDADVVVVGTRGRTPTARAFLGSVSWRVLQDAPCDVLVVR